MTTSTSNGRPANTFVPASDTNLLAWFARPDGVNSVLPVVGYFITYSGDEDGAVPTPEVEPVVMTTSGWVCTLRDFQEAQSDAAARLIGVYSHQLNPKHCDAGQYHAAHASLRRSQ